MHFCIHKGGFQMAASSTNLSDFASYRKWVNMPAACKPDGDGRLIHTCLRSYGSSFLHSMNPASLGIHVWRKMSRIDSELLDHMRSGFWLECRALWKEPPHQLLLVMLDSKASYCLPAGGANVTLYRILDHFECLLIRISFSLTCLENKLFLCREKSCYKTLPESRPCLCHPFNLQLMD